MLLPIGTDRPQERIPWMNFLLIAANIVVYILSHHAPATAAEAMLRVRTAGLDENWARFILDTTPGHLALYQFITYQFLHKDFGHIFGNMLFLYVFGNNLNDKLGHAGYLAFYLAGGIIAGCGQVISHSGPTLGASGAVSAVTGLFFVLLLRTHVRIFFFFVPFYIESTYLIIFSFFRDVIEQALGQGQVAHYAHITGTLCGFFIGLIVLFTGLVERDQYDLLTSFERWKRRRQYEAVVTGHAGRLPLPGRQVPLAQALPRQVTELVQQRRLQEAAGKYLELKSIDRQAAIGANELLDVGNQLAADNRFEEAALAYEDFLRLYNGAPHTEEVYFILGMIYARAYPQRQAAIALLQKALPLLGDPAQRRTAEETLEALQR
jgi:membrane associated rhomboid family serine protease